MQNGGNAVKETGKKKKRGGQLCGVGVKGPPLDLAMTSIRISRESDKSVAGKNQPIRERGRTSADFVYGGGQNADLVCR